MSEPTTDGGVLRVGNCSGFYGDRFSAMREMLTGGELDVLTGDYLAELTMLILGRDRLKDPSLGYARSFVRQVEDCLGLALESGVRLVANAGGLNPAGLAARVREVAHGLGLAPRVAHVEGDDLSERTGELGLGDALTANAYLGARGIATALRGGADVVVTGRVTDASVVVGPALARFGWDPTAYDALAGAVVAGHVIECGTQATGGNFSGFTGFKPDATPLGFPLAEIAADGTSVVTKHPGTGGVVTVDTVTAQLLYEVQSQTYLNPDVATHLDSVRLTQEEPDRVRVHGVRGSAPPRRLKVGLNQLGGHRNTMELVLTGLDIEEKADWVRAQLEARLGERAPASLEWELARTDRPDAETEERASARLRCTAKDPDAEVVGREFSSAVVELALASYPGFHVSAPPGRGTAYGLFRAGYVDRDRVEEVVVHHDGSREAVPDPWGDVRRPGEDPTPAAGDEPADHRHDDDPEAAGRAADLAGTVPHEVVTRRLPLGTFVHARSGDKGGDANVGLWADRSAKAEERVAWLTRYVTADRVRALLPEARDLEVEVHPLPNLGGLNVVIHGLLGDGVAASSRFDPQAKALGEWVRSRLVNIPEDLL